MSPIATLTYTNKMFIFLRKFLNYFPCAIFTSIIHKKYSTFFTYFFFIYQIIYLIKKYIGCNRKYLFLIIAWYNNI